MQTRLSIADRDVVVQQSVERPLDCLSVSLFTKYDLTADPAGLCDGGDYHHGLVLRVRDTEDGPKVFVSLCRYENASRQQMELSYERFWESLADVLAGCPRILTLP